MSVARGAPTPSTALRAGCLNRAARATTTLFGGWQRGCAIGFCSRARCARRAPKAQRAPGLRSARVSPLSAAPSATLSPRKEESPDLSARAFRSVCCCERLSAAAFTAGVSPAEAAYSSSLLQSEWFTDHLHFRRAAARDDDHWRSGLVALPSRHGFSFEDDCRPGLGEATSRRHWDTPA